MKAIVVKKAGGPEVLSVADVDRPRPGTGELLVKVRAATVTVGDTKLRSIPRAILVPVGLIFGFKPMSVAGVEFAGEVAELGQGASGYALGDRVMGTTTGLSRGANAEYVSVPAKPRMGVLTRIPEGLDYETAAPLIVGSMTAWQILKRAGAASGELKGKRVLVYGASGSVGSYAVQLAVLHGATVTAFASQANAELVRSLGAARVLDYRSQALAEAGEQDVIFDAVGKLGKKDCRAVLAKGGSYLSVRGPTSERVDELEYLAGLAAQGKLKPVIDRRIRLTDVPEAHRLVDSGRKKGNIVVTMA